jgi:thioredoxin-like negative regulator of GroEL
MSTAAVLALTLLLPLQAAANSPRPPGRAESKSAAPLTILFFTASWCEPCRAASPILEKFARKNEKRVKLVAVDFDRAKAEAARWGVREIPVVIALSPQGQVLLRYEGAQQQDLGTLASGLESLLKSPEERK